VKCGAGGAVWAAAGEVITVPAPATRVIDTTGAGDAFTAGLLATLADGAGPAAALGTAVRLGSAVVARVGARPGLRSPAADRPPWDR
jgi:ribokinase